MTTDIAAGRSARITSYGTHKGVPRPHLQISQQLIARDSRTIAAMSVAVFSFVFSLILLLSPSTAMAGKASSGELAFYPCTRCHPIGKVPAAERPNKFKGHRTKLEAHSVLGKGTAACLACHDSPKANPGKLKLIDGSLVDITGNVSLVCYRCHEDKYKEWKIGIHGKAPKCTTAGCHDPHTPGWIAISPLLPFLGTSIEVRVLPERRPFTALPPVPEPPPTETPLWLTIVAALGAVVMVSITGSLLFGKSRR